MRFNWDNINMATLLLLAYIAFCFFIGTLLQGCKSTHTISAEGEAKMRHIVDVELSVCNELKDEAEKSECIKRLIELMANLSEAKEKENSND